MPGTLLRIVGKYSGGENHGTLLTIDNLLRGYACTGTDDSGGAEVTVENVLPNDRGALLRWANYDTSMLDNGRAWQMKLVRQQGGHFKLSTQRGDACASGLQR